MINVINITPPLHVWFTTFFRLTLHFALLYTGAIAKVVSWLSLCIATVFLLIEVCDLFGLTVVDTKGYFYLPIIVLFVTWKATSVLADKFFSWSEKSVADFLIVPDKVIITTCMVMFVIVSVWAGLAGVFTPEMLSSLL